MSIGVFIPTAHELALCKVYSDAGSPMKSGTYEPCNPGCIREDAGCHCNACGETGRMLFNGYCAKCAPSNDESHPSKFPAELYEP